MRIDIEVDLRGAMRKLELAEKQARFAGALTLTRLAGDVRDEIPAMLNRHLDKPAPFTTDRRGTFVERATPSKMTAVVGFRPLQSAYLKYQIEGGIRAPKRKALRLPTEQPLDAFGNLPARTIATLIAKSKAKTARGQRLSAKQAGRLRLSQQVTIFYGDPGDGRPPGLYQRVPLPGSGDNRLIPLIVFPQQSARYEKRLPFYEEARAIVQRNLGRRWRESVAEATRTAR